MLTSVENTQLREKKSIFATSSTTSAHKTNSKSFLAEYIKSIEKLEEITLNAIC